MYLPFISINWRCFIVMSSLVMLSFFTTTSYAESVEKLLMPGPLIQGHAKYEEQCSQCHQPLGKKPQKALCLECHKSVNKDVIAGKGFHGNDTVREADCKSCHTDHRGRQAKIVLLNPVHFDHDQTDYQLKGSHTSLQCNQCHKSGKKYREAPHACADCHRNDDIHKGELGSKCQNCHNETSWKKFKFDHSKTKFQLKGKHKDTACLSCHVSTTYQHAPTGCYDCHEINDVHGKTFGKDCADCHNETKWEKISFNHDKTKYPLTGSHKKVRCNSCHQTDIHKALPTDCYGCHRGDDIHSGRNGKQCKSCHTTQRWKTKFDHNKDTKFSLLGAHKNLECTNCHQGVVDKKLATSCFGCHKQDDVHEGSQGKTCDNCHNQANWQQNIVFDHDLTQFPLVGLHATVSCEDCHLSANFKQTETSCVKCHQADDIHKNKLGPVCQNCHTPNSWNLWSFDHSKQTQYPLTGKHVGLTCVACHTAPVKQQQDLKISSDCISCHRQDDAHEGRFGQDCSRCHNTQDFEAFRFKNQ